MTWNVILQVATKKSKTKMLSLLWLDSTQVEEGRVVKDKD